jgi:hypothetical protein
MQFPELRPLWEKVEPLQSNASTYEVYEFVRQKVERASTPAMAQSACESVATMCHPKAWGDRNVQEFGAEWTDWYNFLEELEALATSCAQAIYDHQRLSGAGA